MKQTIRMEGKTIFLDSYSVISPTWETKEIDLIKFANLPRAYWKLNDDAGFDFSFVC